MKAKTNNSSLFEQKVKEILVTKVRPHLLEHGGDVRLKEIKDGNVWLAFDGKCKTCPSAKYTIEDVVDKVLRAELGDELGEVYLVNEIDSELLSFAKKLLNSKK